VEFAHSADPHSTTRLGREICDAVLAIGPSVREVVALPCHGASDGTCHADGVPECRATTILLIDSSSARSVRALLQLRLASNGVINNIIPVLLPGATEAHLPANLARLNAMRWRPGDRIAVGRLLSAVGLASARPGIFISYVRSESEAIATQIFDALGRDGFDVFLDKFSMPPGIDFHDRLATELVEKGTLLVLESKNIHRSKWVGHEISFARAHRLGLIALTLPAGHRLPAIHNANRRPITKHERTPTRGLLRKGALEELVPWIRTTHLSTEARRRAVLIDNMSDALLKANKLHQRFEPEGTLVTRVAPGAVAAIRLSTSPPTLRDFQEVDGHRSRNGAAYVIAPARYADWRRREQLSWLEQKSVIELWDESEMNELARTI
jgi:hypothetical protein